MKIKEKVHINQRRTSGGGYSLFLDYRVGGKRIREFLRLYLVPPKTSADKIKNSETLRIAAEMKNRRIRELDAGELAINLPKRIENTLAVDYIGKLVEKIQKQHTRKSNIGMLKHLKEFAKNATLAEIDRNFYSRFLEFLSKEKRLHTNTVRLYGVILVARLRDAYANGKITTRPDFHGITPKKIEQEIDFLTIEELRKLNEVEYDDKIKNPFMFACFTGLRLSDIESLRWEDITNDIIDIRMKKTSVLARIPLSKNAKMFLPEPKSSGPIFKKFCRNTLFRHLNAWAKEAGVNKHLHFHMSRHTFATLASTSGVDIFTVSKLLGHKDVKTTQIYAKVIDESRKKAVEAIPSL